MKAIPRPQLLRPPYTGDLERHTTTLAVRPRCERRDRRLLLNESRVHEATLGVWRHRLHSDSSPASVPAATMPNAAWGSVAAVAVVGGRRRPGTKKAATVAAMAATVRSANPWV